jgi:glycogen debranching enzyme
VKQLKDLERQLETKEGLQITDLKTIISKMNLLELNKALYSCDAEERDLGYGGSAYVIPGMGPLVYCGLQGVVSILADITPFNDLGHPICINLREGNWLIGKWV